METLTIAEPIPTRDLLLSVTDPDEHGMRYYVARVRHRHIGGRLCTLISYLPLPQIPSPPLVVDDHGVAWIRPDAAERDPDGITRPIQVHA